MEQKVKWHLPGFCYFFYLNQIVIHMMKENPEWFREGYVPGSVYGTFPGAIWNGGRAVFGITSKGDMKQILNTYERFGVPVRFTWTNPLIEEKHVQDTYCNLIMELADNGKNEVLVNSPVLEEYLRTNYPHFGFISSTTKRITSLDKIEEELKKNYKLVVLDYDLNHNEEVLKALEPVADRVEILVDEICFPGCTKRLQHYEDEARMQLTYEKGTVFPCPNRDKRPSFEECKKRPAFISNEEIENLVKRGFQNFKIVGRGLPQDMVLDSYLYYLVRENKVEVVREKIGKTLATLTKR